MLQPVLVVVVGVLCKNVTLHRGKLELRDLNWLRNHDQEGDRLYLG